VVIVRSAAANSRPRNGLSSPINLRVGAARQLTTYIGNANLEISLPSQLQAHTRADRPGLPTVFISSLETAPTGYRKTERDDHGRSIDRRADKIHFRDMVAVQSREGVAAGFVHWLTCRENVFAADDGVSA
jgi:hypothetical protein